MRTMLLLVVVLTALPSAGRTQPADSCSRCTIGLWIGSFSANYNFPGENPPYPIAVKLGYWSSDGASVQAIEFSISGLDGFLVSFEPPPGATLVVGSPPAPQDTSGTDTGGMMITWDDCHPPGDVSVMSLFLTPIDPRVQDQVLWVLRRFPPTVDGTVGPTFTKCGAGEPTAAPGGCFVVNPSFTQPDDVVDGCHFYAGLAVEKALWSRIKILYR